MKLKKLLQYGLMATCLFGNAIAMNENYDTPKYAISRHQSLLDIKAASEIALAESREFHIFLGANPSEAHVVELRAAEEKREREEGIKAPIRLFFVNACNFDGPQTPSAKTPILHANFNNEESWNTILEALMLKNESFNGVFDKIYFDVSTAKFSRWDEGILAKIAISLKKSGELYIPRAKLASQSSFCDSEFEPTYRQRLEIQQDSAQQDEFNRPFLCSQNPKNISTPLFSMGGCLSSFGMRDGKMYVTNKHTLVYDTTFQYSEIIGRPLKFEIFESDKMYPTIGMEYRQLPKDIIECIRINSFIKVTLEGQKEAEETIFNIPVVNQTKENVTNEIGYEPSLIATSTETPIEKESVINDPLLELSSKEIPIREGYREIKLPSLAMIKEKLLRGGSTICSETDYFHFQSIAGTFCGFGPEVKDFDIKMRSMLISKDNKGFYGLFLAFTIKLESSIGIGINLISDRQESSYIFEGGTNRKDNFCLVSDPEDLKIITPIKKKEAEKTIFKAPTVDEIAKPIISPKPTIIHSLRYCPDLYLKIKNNAEAIEKIHYDESHNLQDSKSRGLLLEIRRELGEAEEIIDKIENPLTTPQDRTLVAGIFAPDRLEFMQMYMSAAQKHPELSNWLQKIGFAW